MAELFNGQTFDATGVQPKQDFEILEPGEYPVVIVKSEMKPTKAGTGQMLVLEMDVADGPMKGRKVWDRLNLVNPNATAQEIAERTLSAICHATGVMSLKDSEQLHGLPMIAVVKVKPGDGQYGPSNEISTYKPMGSATPAQAAQAYQSNMQQGAQAAAPAGDNLPPWRRNAA